MKSAVNTNSVNAIRILSAEAISKANSGHPGFPLGASPMMYSLWTDTMRHNPLNSKWQGRDRFVLSAGHGSAMLYSALHLCGYKVSIDDLKQFRQHKSNTPGHPEYGVTDGVETSTGPLGQGFANAVGMAQAQKLLAAKFNKPGYNVIDNYTYCIAGDGCMMEGITYEAASLAGAWGLNKLIVFYDSNDISIEGNINIAFREDVAARFCAQGWHVLTVADGTDTEAIREATEKAKQSTDKPTLIIVKTVIGYGSPLAGSSASHGAPLSAENLQKTREAFGWSHEPFKIPKEIYDDFSRVKTSGAKYEEEWNKLYASYKKAYPETEAEFSRWLKNEIPDLRQLESLWEFEDKPDATRNASGIVLNKLAKILGNFVGGSADLASSNMTIMKGFGDFAKETPDGQNMHFGIREHAMSAICNGMYLYGGINVYCATFMVFSDYMKNAMRMSAIMKLPVTYVLTHDSIGVGEDGPTHQPIEQLAALRTMPGMKVWRPCDGRETAAAWIDAISGKGPASLILSRQKLPQVSGSGVSAFKGAYVISKSEKQVPDAIILASGSEVEVAINAQKLLKQDKIDASVVSVPCMEIFDRQDKAYRDSVLLDKVRARIAVEAGCADSWYKYIGLDGKTVCINTFGESAPAEILFKHFGLTPENVAKTVKEVLGNK